MKNTTITSNIQSAPASVGSFTVMKTVFGFAMLLAAGTVVPSTALAWHCTLSVSPTTIQSGSSATLTWSSVSLTALSIDNGIGNVTPVAGGSVKISPTANTTYTGSGSSPEGPVTCTTNITVTPPPPPPPPVPCCTLSASPSSIQTGSSSTLSWTTQNATSFTIDKSVGSVTPVASGSKSVSPANTTTYTGTATGPGGTVTCTTTVTVTQAPPPPPPNGPTCTLSANASSINTGDSSTLSWTTTNATTLSIDNSVGSVTPVDSGSTSVTPANTTTYTGTATGAGGTVTCTTTVTVTPPGGGGTPPELACTLSASPSSVNPGDSSTLSWTTSDATDFTIDNGVGDVTPVAAGSTSVVATTTTTYTGLVTGPLGTMLCQTTVTVTPPTTGGGCSGDCGGGGGGGGPSTPNVVLSSLPHVGNQPLTYLYLSQIPYTGLDLGTFGTLLYWAALIAWALALAYLVLFGAAPFMNRSLRRFGSRVKEALNAQSQIPAYAGMSQHIDAAVAEPVAPAPAAKMGPYERPRGYSSYEGFKSFANNGSLSIDDIVKGLARSHSISAPVVEPKKIEYTPKAEQNIEPVYENVEPIYENIEPIMNDPMPEAAPIASAPAHIRGLVAALVEGDRTAVFAGLRQQIRGGGSSEKLVSDIAVLLDDAYRARIDGTQSDADTARLVARLDTPTLEKLVASLTTAIDSSYTTNVTGAKIALTRALAVLGA